MKRCVALLLGLAAAPVLAGPQGSWVELDYGRASLENDRIADVPENDELSQRLAGQISGEQGMFIRYDFRRDSVELDYTATYAVPGVEPPAAGQEYRRQFMGLSIGRTVPLGDGTRLTGEIGYGRVENRYELPVFIANSDDVVTAVQVERVEADDDTPFARLALGGPMGPFDWNLEAEYMESAPQPVLLLAPQASDSEVWWNARFGYAITPSWNIGVRYADAERFTATTLSVRWQL